MSDEVTGILPRRVVAQDDIGDAVSRRRVIIAGGVGSLVEFYDFGIYGYLATTTAGVFFPTSSPASALLATLAIFATAFVVRPIGSVLFGHMGDRVGRKPALAWSVIAMALATFVIGLLPTAATIGAAAPTLLVLARLIQGLSAGGEAGGAATMLGEASLDHHRGLLCSTTQAGGLLGLLLSSAVIAVLSVVLTAGEIHDWGWRLPFLFALPTGLVGWYIRSQVEDSGSFARILQTGQVAKLPAMEAFRTSFPAMLRTFGICVMDFVGYYLVFVYLNIYLQNTAHLTRTEAIWSTSLTLLVATAALPCFGMLSDKVGRRPIVIGSSIAFLLLTLPMFRLINSGSVGLAILAQIVLGLCVSSIMGVLWAAIAEMFPTAVRYSGMGIAFSLTAATVGGTTPYIAAWLTQETGDPKAPAYYMMTAAAVTLGTVLAMRETAGRPLPD